MPQARERTLGRDDDDDDVLNGKAGAKVRMAIRASPPFSLNLSPPVRFKDMCKVGGKADSGRERRRACVCVRVTPAASDYGRGSVRARNSQTVRFRNAVKPE